MAGKVGGKIVTSGLVLCLDAANRNSYVSGSKSWFDLTNTNVTGSMKNGTGFSYVNSGVMVFDGTNDYSALNKQIFSSTDNFTISTWLKSNGTQNTYAVPISQGHTAYTGFAFQIGYPSATDMVFILANGSVPWNSVSFSYNANSDLSWRNLVVTKNGNNFITYNNGIQIGTLTLTMSYGTYNFEIGRDTSNTDSSHRCWNGNIANVSLYNRALSASEILQNFNATRKRFNI